MTGLAPDTLAVAQAISTLPCIQNFTLVGGTAIAIQLNHRLSEDLDFCKWVPESNATNGIEVKVIEHQLKDAIGDVKTNQLSFDQVDFYAKSVKLTFFNEVGFNVPPFEPVQFLGNIKFAPLPVIASMKVKTMFERTALPRLL
jgi:hypothetical protein